MTAIAGRMPRRLSQRPSRAVVILCILVVALAVAAGVLFFQWRSAQAAASARTSAVTAANTDVPALLSYSYTSFGTDLAHAEADATAGFRATYGNLMTGQIEPTAVRNKVVTETTVSSTSVVSTRPGTATLLMFLSQQTKTSAKTEPVLNDTAVQVVMRQVNSKWLVDNLLPKS